MALASLPCPTNLVLATGISLGKARNTISSIEGFSPSRSMLVNVPSSMPQNCIGQISAGNVKDKFHLRIRKEPA